MDTEERQKEIKKAQNQRYYQRQKAAKLPLPSESVPPEAKLEDPSDILEPLDEIQINSEILPNFSDPEIKIFPDSEHTEKKQSEIKGNIKPILKILILVSIVIAVCYFEIHESQKFYKTTESDLSLFKSVLAVVSIMVISVLKTTEFRALRMCLMLILIGNQIWIMSSGVVLKLVSDVKITQQLDGMILDLKNQIKPKQDQLDWFKTKEWITRARKQDDKITPFYKRLHDLEAKKLKRLEQGKVSVVMIVNGMALVILRISFLIVGLICCRELISSWD